MRRTRSRFIPPLVLALLMLFSTVVSAVEPAEWENAASGGYDRTEGTLPDGYSRTEETLPDGHGMTEGTLEGRTAEPQIALTYRPVYGESRPFQGVVFMEDGSAFDPAAYRISLYLQLSEGGDYWVKPTYDTPYAPVYEDGSFSIAYATGGSDVQAKILHIMLIPASWTPGTSFTDTFNQALFYVKVTRTAGGDVTVDPDLSAPPPPGPPTPPIPSGLLPVARDKIAVDVGFYTDGSQPGSTLSEALIRRQLEAVSKFSDTVRFYSAGGEVGKAYAIARSMGFTVLGNAWLSKDKTANQAELDALIAQCNQGYVKIAIVGSEVLLRGDLTAGELVNAIQYVRDNLTDPSIPVTTADSVDKLIAAPSVRNTCNLLMPNCYPYWGGSGIGQAAEHFISNMEALDALRDGKEIVVSETGWPTAGQGIGQAKAGESEAARYYAAIREWSLSTNTQVLYFEAADEPWKVQAEGESGAHWGFLTTEFAVKDCYASLNPFAQDSTQEYDVEYVGSSDTSVTVSLTNRTMTAVNAAFFAAAYDADGRMAAYSTTTKSLASAASASLTVSYGADQGVAQVKAFVLDADTLRPLREAWVRQMPVPSSS